MNYFPISTALDRIFNNLDSSFYKDELRKLQAYNQDPVWSETEDSYKLEMIAPRMDKKDIDISIEENVLNLSTYYQEDKKEDDKKSERVQKSSYRWRLPKDADKEKISASLKRGVLEVKIDKSPKPEATKIEIIEVE